MIMFFVHNYTTYVITALSFSRCVFFDAFADDNLWWYNDDNDDDAILRETLIVDHFYSWDVVHIFHLMYKTNQNIACIHCIFRHLADFDVLLYY